MIKIYTLIILVFIGSAFEIVAQNLVPNSSFEELNPNPRKGYSSGINLVKYWVGANFGPGDYYYRNNLDKTSSVPSNVFGTQEPHSGNAYTGICVENGFMEYIQIDLLSTLEKDKTYKISFYLSKCDKRKSKITEIGILFLEKKKEYFLGKGIPLKPQIEFINKEGFEDEENWNELSSEYTAEGFEKTIVLGHFIFDEPNGYIGKSHYYIDDVTVVAIDSSEQNINIGETIIDTTNVDEKFIIGNKIILNNIAFNTNEALLTDSSSIELLQLVEYLMKYPNLNIKIFGHTDNNGAENHNKNLSICRAKAVADFLNNNGILKDRLSFVGYGSSLPIGDNTTKIGQSKNRRVEIEIFKKN